MSPCGSPSHCERKKEKRNETGQPADKEHGEGTAEERRNHDSLCSKLRRQRTADKRKEQVSEENPSAEEPHLDITEFERSSHARKKHGVGKAAEPQSRHLHQETYADNDPAIIELFHRKKLNRCY